MNLAELNKVANAMVAPGRGILAADESSGTVKKRFDVIGVESTEKNRRDYRELLFRSPGMAKISGVILFDETIRQKAADGTPLVKVIEEAGTLPGIKVDKGAKPLPFCSDETVTEGLDGLRERRAEYAGRSGYVERVIYEGTREATEVAEETLMQMKKAMGLTGVWNRISRKARDAIKKERKAQGA